MPDATDPDAPTPSSPNDPDWYVRQWEALCDELGTSDPNELLARVQTLKRQMERSDAEPGGDEGLVTISEVEEVFRELNSKIAKLRERNATLAERLEADSDSDDNLGRLHRQTEALFDTLGVTTFDEATDRIRGLTDRIEDLYQEKEKLIQAGFSTPADAIDEIDDLHSEIEQLESKIEQLRSEREQLHEEREQLRTERDQLQEEIADAESAPDAPDTAALDAATALQEQGIESPEQVEALSRVVENLHDRIRDWVDQYGVDTEPPPDSVIGMLRRISNHLTALPEPDALPSSAADALGATTAAEAETLADLIHSLAAQFADALNVDRDTLAQADARTLLLALDDTDLSAAGSDADAPSGDALPAEAGDILGIQTVEDARELEDLIDDMSERLDQLREGHRKLDDAGLSPDSALSMIENMEAQLADLYHHSDRPQTSEEAPDAPTLDADLRDRIETLLDTPTDAADDLSAVVRRLVDRLDTLSDEHAVLTDADLTAPEAVERIEALEAQLDEQQTDDADQSADGDEAARRLAAIDDVLGISTREEAEELSAIAHQMEEQLTMLYEEKQKLQDLGLSSIEDAADMIESMEAQLDDLYEDKEALRTAQDDGTDQQSTFQQLEALYAERQKLQQALGVSDAEDVIEMVETLTSQLDDLYTGRDAEVDPEERHDAQLWSPDAEAVATDPDDTREEDANAAETTITLTSMEQQLEALYREKEVLLEQGFGSAEEAVTRLQTQKRQIDVLQRENHTYRQRFDRLKAEFGTERVPQIVDLVHTLEAEAEMSADELDLGTSSTEAEEYGVNIDAAAPLVPTDILEQLDERDDVLSSLDVGAMCLNDDGTVAALNEQALQLPGLEDTSDRSVVIGKNFFHDLAPSTNNNLFFGRFQKGLDRGELDARFPYTFTSPAQESQSFLVHLYRAPDSDDTWLFFRPS
jgi:photoactive yellow protein